MRPAPSTPTSSAWTRTPVPRPPRARRARRRRWVQRAAVVGLALLSAVTALHSVLNSAMVRTRLRDRVEAALAARLGGVELGSHSEVDWGLRLSFGPVRISPEPGSPVVMEMERVRVRPRWTALLAGRLEPGLVQLRTVVVRPGTHLEGLKALARRLQSRPGAPRKEAPASAAIGPRLPRLEIQDLRVELVSSQDGHPLDLGAWDAQVEVSGGASTRVLELAVAARRRWRGALHRALGARSTLPGRGGRGRHAAAAADRAAWPARGAARDRGLGHRTDQRAVLPADLRRGELEVSGRVDGLFLEGSRLAAEPVGPWRLSGAGTVDWDRGSREVRLRDGHIGFGENDSLRVNLEGVYEGTRSPRFRAEARVDQLRYQDAIDALPPQFSLGNEAPRIPGLLDARVRVSGAGARSRAVDARREARPHRAAGGQQGDARSSSGARSCTARSMQEDTAGRSAVGPAESELRPHLGPPAVRVARGDHQRGRRASGSTPASTSTR